MGSNDLGIFASWDAFFAALSTFSFPWIPLCPGAQMKTIDMEAAVHDSRRMCMREIRGWEGPGWEIALSEVRESVTIKKGCVVGVGVYERMH